MLIRVFRDDAEFFFYGTTDNFHLTKIQAWNYLVKHNLAKQTELNLVKFGVYDDILTLRRTAGIPKPHDLGLALHSPLHTTVKNYVLSYTEATDYDSH
jgi:hypothetical protein